MKYFDNYKKIILDVMSYLIKKYDFSYSYPWIDTKFDIMTGKLFKDELRGKNTVYSWIQGRGLESIVSHIQFINQIMPSVENLELTNRLHDIVENVLAVLIKSRKMNNGHLFFTLDPEGKAKFVCPKTHKVEQVKLAEDSPYNYSDLFCAKGMYAAAKYLKDDVVSKEMLDYCLSIHKSIMDREFRTDQQTLDPKNPVQYEQGKYSHGPYMISIGMFSLLAANETDEIYVDMGLNLIEHIIRTHINIDGRWEDLLLYDFVEFVDDAGEAYLQDGVILNDPGHSLEFVGLTLKLTDIIRKKSNVSQILLNRVGEIESVMYEILKCNFYQAFSDKGGICKQYDLGNRKPYNTDMPWWSLPETIRAATYCMMIVDDEASKSDCQKIIDLCNESFINKYVVNDLCCFQYQTLNCLGEPSNVIPATPDLDPGYHTGICLIDSMRLLLATSNV